MCGCAGLPYDRRFSANVSSGSHVLMLNLNLANHMTLMFVG